MNSSRDSDSDEPSKKIQRLSTDKHTMAKSKDKEKHKHKLDSTITSELESPLKKLKIDHRIPQNSTIDLSQGSTSSSNSDVGNAEKPKIQFVLACKEVLSKEFYDVRYRLHVDSLPNCCLDKALCRKNHNEKVTSFSELSYEPFRIDMQAGMWIEALDVCRAALKYNKYPNVLMMQNIMKIILNLHEDRFKSYSLPVVLRHSQSTFKLILSTHPPCVQLVRKMYLNFLTMQVKWDCMYQDREDADDKCNLFNYTLNRLQEELADDSPNGSITDLPNFDNRNNLIGLNEAYMLKNRYETHQNLPRRDRIMRLFAVLDLIVNLLERDLCIWVSRYIHNPRKHMMGRYKPLIASLIWLQNDIFTGSVNNGCKRIFQLFLDVVKLEFPTHNINTVSRLVNLVSYVFYSCDESHQGVYPNIGKYCNGFAEEMFKIIEGERVEVILEVIIKSKTKYMQYLLANIALKRITRTTGDFLDLALHIFEKRTWSSFSKSSLKSDLNQNVRNSDFESRLRSSFVKRPEDKSVNVKNRKPTVYKHLLNQSECGFDIGKQKISNVKFILIFYHTFKYYLELYNIENIRAAYARNIDDKTPERKAVSKSVFVTNDRTYDLRIESIEAARSIDDGHSCDSLWSEDCNKHYRNVFKNFKKMKSVYSRAKLENSWIHYFFQNTTVL